MWPDLYKLGPFSFPWKKSQKTMKKKPKRENKANFWLFFHGFWKAWKKSQKREKNAILYSKIFGFFFMVFEKHENKANFLAFFSRFWLFFHGLDFFSWFGFFFTERKRGLMCPKNSTLICTFLLGERFAEQMVANICSSFSKDNS